MIYFQKRYTTFNDILRYISMKHELYIPQNLMEIPLGRYQKFLKTASEEDNHFNRMSLVACITATDINIVRLIKQSEFDNIYNHLVSILNQKPKFIHRFKIDGFEFGAIPNIDEISVGETADLDTYYRNWEDMHKAMSVMYRPISESKGKEYLIEKYDGTDKYSALMKFAPLEVALGMHAFFLTLCQDLEHHFLSSFQREMREQTLQENHSSTKSGDGIPLFTELLGESIKELKKHQEQVYSPHLRFLNLNEINLN